MTEEEEAMFLEELGGFAGDYLSLRDDPEAFLSAILENGELREALARADTSPLLRSWFTPRDEGEGGWVADGQRSGAIGKSAAGTEWSFLGVHDQNETFNGIRATGREVEVRGYTLMSIESTDEGESRVQLRRYVDWVGLYGQLGLSVNWRVPLPHEVPDLP